MNTVELRNKLISLIKTADLSSLKRIESLLVESDDYGVSKEHKELLDERLKTHETDRNAGKPLDMAKAELATKYGI